jgi:hypothetical protein
MNSAGIPSTPIGDQPTTIRAGKVWKRIKKNRERFGPVIASWAGTHVCEEKGDHRPWSIWPSSQLNRRKLPNFLQFSPFFEKSSQLDPWKT